MSRLVNLIESLRERMTDDEGTPISQISYKELIDGMQAQGINDLEVLESLRSIVIAHMATGVGAYLSVGGPESHDAGLQLQPGKDLVGLYASILEAEQRWLELHPKETLCSETIIPPKSGTGKAPSRFSRGSTTQE
ncbi:MAG: hypothetical protein DRJ03_06885 [Chloroflexi bacterium]|nr:MAG: hypothetical protein DRJ03_06885 [Chloroflexota bacterium]